ncbi:hypothetical protein Q5H93_02865 [Hymenobacter sp. ASUV-10]|uniref:YtxH domain-containing protein n=1 Tax=Hymenobacter aranciens TaxID=3063996 RepID=A0ABT9B5W8_9BACT|nr:hypothetical protein [Hymenobacter sp. ASUV-10]MDO7873660.1 hypothetical protein [Hymenobacter sp. ASUV-10]
MNKHDIANTGADMAGGLVGAGIGLAVAGPPGAYAGAAIGPMLANGIKDVLARVLSPRERKRVDLAAAHIEAGMRKKLEARIRLRQDDFFDGADRPSNADEILEGVLLKCQIQYQERKVKLIANIAVNTAFDESISIETANQALNTAERLTYQELCLLAYFGRKEEFASFPIMVEGFYGYPPEVFHLNSWNAIQSAWDLFQSNMIKSSTSSTPGALTVLGPGMMVLTERGTSLFNLLELQSVPSEDVLTAIEPLFYRDEMGVNEMGKRNGVYVGKQ